VTERVLLLTPSRGRGGGIERYVETLEWAFAERGIQHVRVDLCHPGRRGRARGHARMLLDAHSLLRATGVPTRLVVAHRALLPAASLLARDRAACGISVVCHGTDVWGDRPRLRQSVENHLMRRPNVRVVAVSSFTAGALAGNCPATVLSPGLSRSWFQTLVDAANHTRKSGREVQVITTFRLADWRGKGLPQVLEAVAALGRTDVRVTVCGSGDPPFEMEALLRKHRFCTLRPGLTDRELAGELAAADLFVLATRTRPGRDPSGEGFGLVLLEAQVAGTPVIGPACGGSHDAYVDGITGRTPIDETSMSLTAILSELVRDRYRLQQMGRRAADWSREYFAPEQYASRVVAGLL
jgi:phosphatidyl-myo-inositol dimannoside synthase